MTADGHFGEGLDLPRGMFAMSDFPGPAPQDAQHALESG